MENLTSCPLCKSTKFSSKIDSFDYFLSKEPFNIAKCDSCGFLFTNPRPFQENASKYYESEEYLSHNQNNQGLLSQLYKLVRNYNVKQKSRLIQKYAGEKTILDIGCGTGEFLNELKNRDFQVQGIEVNSSARNFARNFHKLEVYRDLNTANFNPDSFGVITMWHVLEHVYHLHETINEIKRILKDNGTLIVALPNPESYDANLYGKFWAGYDLPRHIYHFSSSNVKNLFNAHGFKVINIKPMYFDAYYVSLLSEKYIAGHMNYFKAFYRASLSNFKAMTGSGNYSSLIYILKPQKT